MIERRCSILQSSNDSQLSEFLQHAYYHRDLASELGPFHSRFECHIFSYAKSLEIARHRYFLCLAENRAVDMMDAAYSFSDLGYETGLYAHWNEKFRKKKEPALTMKSRLTLTAIVRATSLEAAHCVIGDYSPMTMDGSKIHNASVEQYRQPEQVFVNGQDIRAA